MSRLDMTMFFRKKNETVAHKPKIVVPRGIDKNEFIKLYNLSIVKKVAHKQVLIREGDIDQTAYFILMGRVQIIKRYNNQFEKIAILGPGNWVGEISLIRKVKRTASAVAIEPSIVMGVNLNTLTAVSVDTQLYLFKHFASLSANRIELLEDMEAKLKDFNKGLINNLQMQRITRQVDASDSELIYSVIKKIPRLPAFARTLTVNTLRDDVSLSQVAKQIKQDPSLVSVVLKIINSAYYGFQGKISDIHQAISLLGLNKINQLIISEGIRSTLPAKPVFVDLHSHALAISEIAFIISQKTGKGNPAQIATFGLVHDLGKVVIEYLKDQNPKLEFFLKALDSAQLGSMLFSEWHYPEFLIQCTRYQFHPEFCPPTKIPGNALHTVSIMYLSHLCYDIFLTHADNSGNLPFLDAYLQVLNLKGQTLDQIMQRHVISGIQDRINSYPAPLKELFGLAVKLS